MHILELLTTWGPPVLEFAAAAIGLKLAIADAHWRRRAARHAEPLDPAPVRGHHQKMAAQQPRRRAGLPPAERERRQRQSQADKIRTANSAAAEDERRRRQSQSDSARDRTRAAEEHEEAMYRTVLGGDINFMDKHDW